MVWGDAPCRVGLDGAGETSVRRNRRIHPVADLCQSAKVFAGKCVHAAEDGQKHATGLKTLDDKATKFSGTDQESEKLTSDLQDASKEALSLTKSIAIGPWTLGPSDPWTLGPLDLWTFGPFDPWTLGPLDLWRVPGCKGPRVQRFNGPRVQRSKGPRVQGSKGPRVQGSRGAGVQGPRGARVQGSLVCTLNMQNPSYAKS